MIESDSVEWLSRNSQPIDILYLDSRDCHEPGCAEHGLREIEAAFGQMRQRSLVVFDDTSYASGEFIGLGALGVPWLIGQGWRILHSGHQTMLSGAVDWWTESWSESELQF